ncbi:glycosyltransferase family 4 protein [Galbibacter sp. EGI 63066]|uniref:glycosyltransferase family 4 protein n=1 Tax=Galbibacter sp. EGI 63066 TaxID=2993559 RepID=UPI002248E74F|nr:glycosyltransferase family 4 protein [Galbibacter sp. EGI 63066]MCX2679173.1 glycosyltransferase family 4 protein [Galbibacter sp. EGI 63066]
MKKIIRITTVPQSLSGLLKGQLKYMSAFYNMIAISSNGSDEKLMVDYANKENAGFRIVEMTRRITLFKDLTAFWKLYSIFKSEKPFIVHTHTPKAGTLGMIAAWLAGVPNRLHTIAGLPLVEAKGMKRTLLNNVEKVTYACATKIYPNSHGLSDIILQNKFTNKSKIKIIGNGSSNGIDIHHYNINQVSQDYILELKKKLKIDKNDYVFIYVGRLVKDKGINELVSAFNTLSQELKCVKLLMVGYYETTLDPLLPKTIETIEKHPNIIATGKQKDVRPYFAMANALVFPSYREGFPNVVMQAGAMKLPSIVSNINGCNEIIKEGLNGYIIPVKNRDAIYIAMKKMMQLSTNDQQNMGGNARKVIESNYEQLYVWQELLKEYKALENTN